MKAIEIKSELKYVFLDAVKACSQEVEENWKKANTQDDYICGSQSGIFR